jgi:beta-fructofuranosidase
MKYYIEEANNHVKANKHKVVKRYRHLYHFMSETGWINDPNGFSFFRGEYHLFYQFHPFSSKWGPMYWGHAKSKDLVTWEHLPIALSPLEGGAEGGAAFSGTAISNNDAHYLIYTENWNDRQVQSIAKSLDGIYYERLIDNPVISLNDLSEYENKRDFRDPKIWKKDNMFYVIVSARSNDGSGELLLYKSEDMKQWRFVNSICKSNKEIGMMWECPDLFELDDVDVLLISSQFLMPNKDKFNNLHPAVYMIGELDYEKGNYLFEDYEELDCGFDFYAPQTLIDEKGRRIMIAWMSMWERTVVTDELNHNWAGAMTLPRVLRVIDNNLYQYPIDEIEDYRYDFEELKMSVNDEVNTTFKSPSMELLVDITNVTSEKFGLKLFKNNSEETLLYYDTGESKLTLDRTKSGITINGNKMFEPNSNIRKTNVELESSKLKLRIFIDVSSVEVFIQDGLKTMTCLV